MVEGLDVQRAAHLGQTVDEQTGHGAWQGRGSSPTWVIGEGHKPLEEARVTALTELAEAERLVDQRRQELAEAQKKRGQAMAAADKAAQQLDEARLSLAYRQEDVARRCGVVWEHPEEDVEQDVKADARQG